MNVIFENAGEIDVRSISSFGVSVKDGDNPIGFFGTGLKYAIAVLLRTGHDVTIQSGLSIIRFGTTMESIRGQEFSFVTMSIDGAEPASIGFTTQLGKQWELWMAYREIACNCKDEYGSVATLGALPEPVIGTTRIAVSGDAFAAVHGDRHRYLLEDSPSLVIGGMEVRPRPGFDFFYRGVRVHQFNRAGLFTYNTRDLLSLTEDRTVAHAWEVPHRLAKAILQADDEQFLRDCLTAGDDTLEAGLDFHGWGVEPSATFLRVVGDCVSDRITKVNATAMRVWKESTKQPFSPKEIYLTKVQLASLNRALDFCATIGFQIRDAYPIKVVESLGADCLGLAQDQTIFVAERVFHLGGTKQLASTLIEEYLHLRHGWKDLTRELQSFLFEKMVSLGEELAGEPL
jgi:hypothetical protein